MAVNRQVGYNVGSTSIRGTELNVATIGAGFTLTQFKVTAKFIFAQSNNVATYTAQGVWGVALQYGPTGSPPTAWNSSGGSTSILAFDNAEPEGLERIVWAPNTASMNIVPTFTSSLEWRGQLLLAASTDFFVVPVDVTNAAATYKFSAAWQLWYG